MCTRCLNNVHKVSHTVWYNGLHNVWYNDISQSMTYISMTKQRMQFVFGNTSTASSCTADHLLINGKRCRMQGMHQKEGKKAFLHNSCKAKLGIWNPSQPCNLSNIQSKKHCQKLNRLKDSRSRLNFSSKIWIKCQLQNLDQTFASMSWLNFSFRIFTIYLKSWSKFSFKILIKIHLRNLDQTSIPLPSFSFHFSLPKLPK